MEVLSAELESFLFRSFIELAFSKRNERRTEGEWPCSVETRSRDEMPVLRLQPFVMLEKL